MKICHETIKQNAKFSNYESSQTKYYLKHLDNSLWNPTIGAIAKHQYICDPKYLPEDKYAVKYLKNILKDKINEFYPKTKKIREYIINDNRLNFNYVTKSKGYNILDKLKILMKIK